MIHYKTKTTPAAKPAEPAKNQSHIVGLPGAPKIHAMQTERIAGAFMQFDDRGDGQLLNLVAQKQGREILTYAGYRDGIERDLDKLSIAVNADKSVSIQVVLPGTGSGYKRAVTLTLAQLESAVGDYIAENADQFEVDSPVYA